MKERIKAALAALRGEGATQEQIALAAQETHADAILDALQSEGHLAADADTLAYARAQAAADPQGFDTFMRRARPAPAAPAQTIDPNAPSDPVDAAIKAHMAEHGVPYHEAAVEISRGGTLQE